MKRTVFDPSLPTVLTRSKAGVSIHGPDDHVTVGLVEGETQADVLAEVNATLMENFTKCGCRHDLMANTLGVDPETWRFMSRPFNLGVAILHEHVTTGLEMIMLANPAISMLHVVAVDARTCIAYRRAS